MALKSLSTSEAMAAALCFANPPNGVSDGYVTCVDGELTSGWYATRSSSS